MRCHGNRFRYDDHGRERGWAGDGLHEDFYEEYDQLGYIESRLRRLDVDGNDLHKDASDDEGGYGDYNWVSIINEDFVYSVIVILFIEEMDLCELSG